VKAGDAEIAECGTHTLDALLNDIAYAWGRGPSRMNVAMATEDLPVDSARRGRLQLARTVRSRCRAHPIEDGLTLLKPALSMVSLIYA